MSKINLKRNKSKKQIKVKKVGRYVNKDKKFTLSKKKKIIFSVVSLLFICIAIIVGVINSKLDKITTYEEPTTIVETITTTEKDDTEIQKETEENLDVTEKNPYPNKNVSITGATSINDYAYKWANNSGPLYKDSNVLNVLLLGLDSDTGLSKGGRSDSMILLSLNKQTKQITMTSLFRDTWTYIKERGTYDKMNSSYFYGGPSSLINTIERNFKIDIDHFVAVDFSSFTEIIDALGGVTVEVKPYEASYINRVHGLSIKSGSNVTLNGKEALVFARIRKSDADSDVSRTRRQRQVITALINKFKNASLKEINTAVDILFSNIKTDLTKKEIISTGTEALMKGWANYEIKECVLTDKTMFGTGWVGSKSVVLMDFPLATEKMQKAIYNDTNVVITESKINILNF